MDILNDRKLVAIMYRVKTEELKIGMSLRRPCAGICAFGQIYNSKPYDAAVAFLCQHSIVCRKVQRNFCTDDFCYESIC